MTRSHIRIAALALLLVSVLALSFAPKVIAAGPKTEYKFVRLVDEGAMPVISNALNREADRGWILEEMAISENQPRTIYLVFKK